MIWDVGLPEGSSAVKLMKNNILEEFEFSRHKRFKATAAQQQQQEVFLPSGTVICWVVRACRGGRVSLDELHCHLGELSVLSCLKSNWITKIQACQGLKDLNASTLLQLQIIFFQRQDV